MLVNEDCVAPVAPALEVLLGLPLEFVFVGPELAVLDALDTLAVFSGTAVTLNEEFVSVATWYTISDPAYVVVLKPGSLASVPAFDTVQTAVVVPPREQSRYPEL